jgi:perosamine synthetase
LERFNEARIANARYLSQHLEGVVTPTVPEGRRHVFHQYTVRVADGRRDVVREGLGERGVGTGVYYPVPVHHQRIYVERGYDGTFPEAERAAAEVLSLPVHPGLSSADLETIVTAVNELCG